MPSSVPSDLVPHSLFFLDQALFYLPPRVFGCICFVHILNLGQDKLSVKPQSASSLVIAVKPVKILNLNFSKKKRKKEKKGGLEMGVCTWY